MKAFVLIADALGFSAMVTRLPPEKQDERVRGWVSLVTDAARDADVERLRLFSDTIFAAVPQSTEGLAGILNLSQLLLDRGIENGFPLRGGVDLGDVEWAPDVVYGTGIVRAYRLEETQQWLGISCTYAFRELDELWALDRVCLYPAPIKNERSMPRPCVSWNVPASAPLTATLKQVAPSTEDELDDGTVAKIKRTEDFARYLALARRNEWDPSKFHM